MPEVLKTVWTMRWKRWYDYGRAKTYTVGTWLEVWMENYAKIKLRPSTYKTSQGFLKTTSNRRSAASRWQT